MSGREWKPGDVAMVDGHVALAQVDEKSPRATFVYTDSDGDPCSVWVEGCNARPLVVIDPEDREAVGEFRDLLDPGRRFAPLADYQAALRSLVTPPTPEEPTGLGAVVEDAEGDLWVRVTNAISGEKCWKHNLQRLEENRVRYDSVAAVKVLSEGVTP